VGWVVVVVGKGEGGGGKEGSRAQVSAGVLLPLTTAATGWAGVGVPHHHLPPSPPCARTYDATKQVDTLGTGRSRQLVATPHVDPASSPLAPSEGTGVQPESPPASPLPFTTATSR
jgi:hypothetical protein